MEVLEMLKNHVEEGAGYFILDSHEKSDHGDVDYKYYYYNTRRFNKLQANDVFVYRRPAKGSKERIFKFFGGGLIEKIEKLDDEGNVRAHIKNAFKFLVPLKQGDEKLESYDWQFKKRTPGSYERFFNQYGMTMILKADFEELFGGLDCVPAQTLSTVAVSKDVDTEEEQRFDATSLPADFAISVVNEQKTKVRKSTKSKKRVIVKKTDFNGQYEKNMKLGEFGELKILQYEIEYLKANGRGDLAEKVEHSSKKQGDGLGYDISSFELDGTPKYIEVKTTRKNAVDGFFMSQNEINVSEEKENYYIYRLYNVKENEGTADLYIYSGPCNQEKFRLTPTSYRVNLK